MAHRIHTLVHSVQPSSPGSLIREILAHPNLAQLLERNQPMLPQRNSSDLPIRTPPTGLKAIYFSTLRPVGGGGGGHAGTLT